MKITMLRQSSINYYYPDEVLEKICKEVVGKYIYDAPPNNIQIERNLEDIIGKVVSAEIMEDENGKYIEAEVEFLKRLGHMTEVLKDCDGQVCSIGSVSVNMIDGKNVVQEINKVEYCYLTGKENVKL